MHKPCDWISSNEIRYADAVAARQFAQIEEYSSDVILKKVKTRAERAIQDVDKKIGTKVPY